MKRQTKHSSEQQSEQAAAQQQSSTPAAREFSTAEELLRHDAAHTRVPAHIARRLEISAQSIPAPARSWWRRIFGRE